MPAQRGQRNSGGSQLTVVASALGASAALTQPAPIPASFTLDRAQEQALIVYSNKCRDDAKNEAAKPGRFFLKCVAGTALVIALADVAVSYMVLSFAANNTLFTGDLATQTLYLVGAVIVLNSVGLNTYLNYGVFAKRWKQVCHALQANLKHEVSLLNNPRRLIFDSLRFGFGVLSSLVYAMPFYIAIIDGSRVDTSNELFNEVARSFFDYVAYIAIAVRAALILHSVLSISNLLPVSGRRGSVARVQREINQRIDAFKAYLENKLNQPAHQINNQGLWHLLEYLNRTVEDIIKASDDMSKYQAWGQLGAIIGNPEAYAQSLLRATHDRVSTTVPAHVPIGTQLLEFWKAKKAWLNANPKQALYNVSTYAISLAVACGYLYAQLDKTKQGTRESFGTEDNSIGQGMLVYMALFSAALFSGHWVSLAFAKMAKLCQKNRKRYVPYTIVPVCLTAAPAIAIASDGTTSPLLIAISGIAGALMNFVGQYGVLKIVFSDKKPVATTTAESNGNVHIFNAASLCEKLHGMLDKLHEMLSGHYDLSDTNILAIGRTWGIVIEGSTPSLEFAQKPSCQVTCPRNRNTDEYTGLLDVPSALALQHPDTPVVKSLPRLPGQICAERSALAVMFKSVLPSLQALTAESVGFSISLDCGIPPNLATPTAGANVALTPTLGAFQTALSNLPVGELPTANNMLRRRLGHGASEAKGQLTL